MIHKAAFTSRVPLRRAVARVPQSAFTGEPIIAGGPWTEPTYADSTAGDSVDGEDLDIRRAAVEALGAYNGSVVVVDPNTGRILTMVNQRLALGSGFQPCSTIKVSVALAGLSEKTIDPATRLRLGGLRMDLTYALAHSNNYYFATLGTKLGFEKVSYYAHMFGYGEKAGLNIAGEQPGRYPAAPPKNGGVGMLTSFGEEISQTPLQLAALMSAIANGGTMYYLQYPRSPEAARGFIPVVKRQLNIESVIPVIKPGMRGAVEFGTAHRAREDGPIAGKTGTCSENHTHLGWFGSFNDVGSHKLVVVVLLTGGRPAIGPLAAGIAGDVYRRLGEKNYFAEAQSIPVPDHLVARPEQHRRAGVDRGITHQVDRLDHQRLQIDLLRAQVEAPFHELRNVEQLIDELVEAHHLAANGGEPATQPIVDRRAVSVGRLCRGEQPVRLQAQGGDRRPQLVRGRGEELVPHMQRVLEAGQRLLLLRVPPAHGGQLEPRLYPHQELAAREGLDQEVVGAGLQAGDRLALPGGAGHQDERHILRRPLGAQLPRQLDAAQPRHLHVGDHQIESRAERLIPTLIAPIGECHGPTCSQQQIERGPRLGIVLDHQDARRRFLFRRHAPQRESVEPSRQRPSL